MKKSQEDIEEQIFCYLKRNPDSGETLEGLTKWWINQKGTDIPLQEVEEFCDKLVKKGLLRKHFSKNDSIIYKTLKKYDLQD